MLILIHKQGIMREALELSRMRIAAVLQVPLEAVHAKWETNVSDQVVPNFAVEFPDTTDVTQSMVREVIQTVYMSLRSELRDRLRGAASRHRFRRSRPGS